MKTISIDIETFSDVDLGKCGVYRYCSSPAFEILLFGYSVDGGPVKVVNLACGEKIPEDILDALTDDTVLKWAFNANFERVCLSRYLRDMGRSLDPFHDNHPLSLKSARFLNPEGWRCSMVWAATMGLPLSLKGVGAVLQLADQKMDEGKALIKYFSVPCATTKANGGRTRNLPSDDPGKWATFKKYNQRDVEVEMMIQRKLRSFPVPDFVWDEYHIDQEINDRGVRIDMDLVEKAIDMDTRFRSELTEKMQAITNLENPNSVQQMKQWLSDNGMEVDSLGKKAVTALLKTAPPELTGVLELRQQLAKSSVKKYQTMQRAVCSDSRARGMFMFYGANRTGRWAGRLIQLQNLPQNHLPDLDAARALVKSGDYEAVKMIYEDVPDTLSQLIRTAFIPKDGCRFYVADFSAIEARVIAWYAGEKWKSDAFANGEDIYCSTARRMFHKPVVKHGVNGELRAKGKIAELACGYGGSTGALKAMGALEMGLSEDELPDIVSSWRDANQQIVKFWWDVDKAVMAAVKNHKTTRLGRLAFFWQAGMLFITLPSGRNLAYVKPKVGMNRFGGECITYEGVGGTKKWERLESYGPKFVENIVQGVARDILCFAMKNLRDRFIVGHVHDELIIEVPKETNMQEICDIMGQTPDWMPGLLLRADGYKCMFYQKD